MKDINELNIKLEVIGEKVVEKIIEEQRNTAEKKWEDIVETAPYKNGDYIASIKIGETNRENDTISTSVFTDAKVETKSGQEYYLGTLLEHGTAEHAIPNAWGKGYTYGYVGKDGKYHKGTLDKDWHPGTIAQPHFLPALRKNEALYYNNMRKAVKEAK